MSQKPVIFLTFANDHEGRFLESLRPEQAGIHHQLAKYQNKGEGLYHSSGASEPDLLLKDLNEFTGQLVIFHFSGHSDGAGLQVESQEGEEIMLHGGNLSGILAQEAKQNLTLVFLNACKTKGLLRSLKKIGVPAVIATDREIPDKEAKSFAVAFYRSLVSGNSLETAFMQSKAALEPGIERRRVFRGLEFEEEEEADKIPWGLYIQEEKVLDWKLVDKDPLEDLPEVPISYYQKLPKSPFRNLLPFNKAHAGIFFGRGNEIREIYHKIKSIHPLILYHGQSGVGKSSLLDAGLIPRIEEEYQVIYVKRTQEGSDQTLKKALEIGEEQSLRGRWLEIEEKGNPLVVILDQVEEVYTQKTHADADSELRALFLMLSDCFDSNEEIPAGRMILSYRKEYHAELEHFALDFDLPYTEIFLERLKRKGIVEAIEGTKQNTYTQDKYGIVLETNESGDLAGIIADDLLEDGDSALAPVLQILLSRMWEVSEDKHFSISLYQDLKKEGYLLQDFFERQMGILQEKFPQEVESGLALDLLHTYTTSLGSSNSHVDEVIQGKYEHVPKSINHLLQELVDLYLLFIRKKGERSLSHDTLAPIVQKNHKISDSLGQRALRILENKSHNAEQEKALLDRQDLETVEAGAIGMRSWTVTEQRLIERSKAQQIKIAKQQRLIRRIGMAALGVVLVLGGLAVWQWQIAKERGTQMQSNFWASEAINLLDSEPKKAQEMAVKAWESDKANDFAYAALLKSYYNQVYEYQGKTFFRPEYENFPKDSFLFPSPPYGLDYSSYGEELLVTFWDGSVSLYESSGKKLIHFPGDGETGSRTAKFASDGSGNFAFAVSDSVYVFNRKTQKKSEPLDIPPLSGVQKMEFSADGQTVYVNYSGKVVVWDWGLNTIRHELRPASPIRSLSLDSQNNLLLTGCQDGRIRVWDINQNYLLIDSFKAHNSQVFACAINNDLETDGIWLATGSQGGRISFWNREHELLKTVYTHTSSIYELRFSPDGNYLVSASLDGSAGIWETKPPYSRLIQLEGHTGSIYRACFSSNQNDIYTSSPDGSVKKWNLTKHTVSSPFDSKLLIESMELSQTREELMLTSSTGLHIGSVKGGVWEFVSPGEQLKKSIYTDNPDYLITVGEYALIVWDRENGTIEFQADLETYPTDMAITSDGKHLLLLSENLIHTWELKNGKLVGESHIYEHAHYLTALSVSLQKNLIVDETGTVFNWDAKNSLQEVRKLPGNIRKLAQSPTQSIWAVLQSGENESVYLTQASDSTSHISLSRNLKDINDLSFSPTASVFATGSDDGILRIWNFKGEEIADIKCPHPIQKLTFSKDGNYIFTLDNTGQVLKWLIAGQQMVDVLP